MGMARKCDEMVPQKSSFNPLLIIRICIPINIHNINTEQSSTQLFDLPLLLILGSQWPIDESVRQMSENKSDH